MLSIYSLTLVSVDSGEATTTLLIVVVVVYFVLSSNEISIFWLTLYQ